MDTVGIQNDQQISEEVGHRDGPMPAEPIKSRTKGRSKNGRKCIDNIPRLY